MSGSRSFLDDLKVRVSWGKTGSTNVSDFAYYRYYSMGGKYGREQAIELESTLPNKQLRWEMTTEWNGGLDFSFFGRRLYGSVDIYKRVTRGSLAPSPYALESGMSYFSANLIDMQNQGVEVELGAYVPFTSDFTWDSSFNISSNQNKVLALNGAHLNPAQLNAISVGDPVGAVRGHKVKGIAQDQATIDALNAEAVKQGHPYYQQGLGVGDYIFEDLNGDSFVNPQDTSDETVIATPQHKFFGGWTNNFTYKGFQLSLLFQFAHGGKAVFSPLQEDLANALTMSGLDLTLDNTWTPTNREATYPRAVTGKYTQFSRSLHDGLVFSTSYFKVKNITLSYSLKPEWSEQIGLKNLTLYLTGVNLFTSSPWPGIDPELVGVTLFSASGSHTTPYPLSRTFTFGLRLQI